MTKKKNWSILVVDDDERNRSLMSAILVNTGYVVDTAQDGNEAIEKISDFKPDIILLDVVLPGMSGYDVCAKLKNDPETGRIPIVLVTALTDPDARIRGFDAGANEYLMKPIDAREMLCRVRNLLRIKEFEDLLQEHNELLQDRIKEKVREIKEFHLESIYRLTLVAEYKDTETADHIRRVGRYVGILAKELGYSDARSELMAVASPMHDIGKIGIPDNILLRTALLTQQEREIKEQHTIIGWKMLAGSASSDILKTAATIALTHHERWDGLGYPRGLRGEEIPIEGRILKLADKYDPLRCERPYKATSDHQGAFDILARGDGRTLPGHFDPRVMEAFKDLHGTFNDIFEQGKECPAAASAGEWDLPAVHAVGHPLATPDFLRGYRENQPVEPPPAGAGGSLQERDLPRIPHSSPGGSRGISIRRD